MALCKDTLQAFIHPNLLMTSSFTMLILWKQQWHIFIYIHIFHLRKRSLSPSCDCNKDPRYQVPSGVDPITCICPERYPDHCNEESDQEGKDMSCWGVASFVGEGEYCANKKSCTNNLKLMLIFVVRHYITKRAEKQILRSYLLNDLEND